MFKVCPQGQFFNLGANSCMKTDLTQELVKLHQGEQNYVFGRQVRSVVDWLTRAQTISDSVQFTRKKARWRNESFEILNRKFVYV
jgi:hypothetical protein